MGHIMTESSMPETRASLSTGTVQADVRLKATPGGAVAHVTYQGRTARVTFTATDVDFDVSEASPE
jgi:hypothetical protein